MKRNRVAAVVLTSAACENLLSKENAAAQATGALD